MSGTSFEVDPVTLKVMPTNGQAKKPRARFFRIEEEDKEASKREGRPIFKDVEMIQIFIDENTRPTMRVTDKLRSEYSGAYRVFLSQEPPRDIQGTLLAEMFIMTRARAREYGAGGVYTVEQLAALPDERLFAFGKESEGDRGAARAYLAKVKDGGTTVEAQAREIVRLKKELEEAQEEVKDLTSALRASRTETKERVGSPRRRKVKREEQDVISN